MVLRALGLLPGVEHLHWLVDLPELLAHLLQGLIAVQDDELSGLRGYVDAEAQDAVVGRGLSVEIEGETSGQILAEVVNCRENGKRKLLPSI